jgi:hypothetical protein
MSVPTRKEINILDRVDKRVELVGNEESDELDISLELEERRMQDVPRHESILG